MSELIREIDKVKGEISSQETAILEKRAYLAGLEKALKLQSKMPPSATSLRVGSDAHRAMEVLKAHGEPLHVERILAAMEREVNPQNKVSLTGSLAGYVRKGSIFTRPAPNTFGLVEFERGAQEEADVFS